MLELPVHHQIRSPWQFTAELLLDDAGDQLDAARRPICPGRLMSPTAPAIRW
jgi:hypothetical protein